MSKQFPMVKTTLRFAGMRPVEWISGVTGEVEAGEVGVWETTCAVCGEWFEQTHSGRQINLGRLRRRCPSCRAEHRAAMEAKRAAKEARPSKSELEL